MQKTTLASAISPESLNALLQVRSKAQSLADKEASRQQQTNEMFKRFHNNNSLKQIKK